MITLQTPNKKTDFSKLEFDYYDWDLVIDGSPYQVVSIKDYYHTESNITGLNNLYCFPLKQKPDFKSLIIYRGPKGGVRWDISIREKIKYRHKWNLTSIENKLCVTIFRNDKIFYTFPAIDMGYAQSKANMFLLDIFENYPICFFNRDYQKEIIGRKIYYN